MAGLANADNTADSVKAVASAAVLTTVRTISGVSFNGSANITVTAVDSTARVPDTRTISTTTPLAGGGALSGNLTLTIGAASGSLAGSMSSADFTKLASVATGATANSGDAMLLARANHTGTQSVASILAAATARSFGRFSAAGGAGEELTGTQATSLLDVFTSALKGLVPASGGGTTNFLRADGTWAAAGGAASDPMSLANGTGAAPASGTVKLGRATLAGQDMPSFRTAHSGGERVLQRDIALIRIVGVIASPGTTNVTGALHLPAAGTIIGTATARSITATSRATRQPRIGYVSAATAGALCGYYNNSSTGRFCTISDGATNGGLRFVGRFVVADPATVSGACMFFGLANDVAAPTNVEPNTLTNCIGIAQLSTSANLHFVYGGSTAQTVIDLGVNFLAGSLSADLYELMLFSDPASNATVGYRVERINTGDVASGSLTNTTPGTTLSAATTLLGLRSWWTNNATALAVALDIVTMSVTVEA